MFPTTTKGILVGKGEVVTLEATNAFSSPAVDVTVHHGHFGNLNIGSKFGVLKIVTGYPQTILRFHIEKDARQEARVYNNISSTNVCKLFAAI